MAVQVNAPADIRLAGFYKIEGYPSLSFHAISCDRVASILVLRIEEKPPDSMMYCSGMLCCSWQGRTRQNSIFYKCLSEISIWWEQDNFIGDNHYISMERLVTKCCLERSIFCKSRINDLPLESILSKKINKMVYVYENMKFATRRLPWIYKWKKLSLWRLCSWEGCLMERREKYEIIHDFFWVF